MNFVVYLSAAAALEFAPVRHQVSLVRLAGVAPAQCGRRAAVPAARASGAGRISRSPWSGHSSGSPERSHNSNERPPQGRRQPASQPAT